MTDVLSSLAMVVPIAALVRTAFNSWSSHRSAQRLDRRAAARRYVKAREMAGSDDPVLKRKGYAQLFEMLDDPRMASAVRAALIEYGLDVSRFEAALADLRAAQNFASRASRAPRRALGFAVTIAGRSRVHLRDEWAAVLAGDPDNGLVLTSRQRLRLVVGFLIAALRFRLRDAVRPLWVPVDWVLSVQSRTETFIALVVGAQVIYIAWSDGLHALLTYGWGWCGGCGGALYVLSRWLRRVRGIELAAVRSESNEG